MKTLTVGYIWSFLLKAIGAGAMFFLSVQIARYYGAEGVGNFFLALTIVTTLSTISRLGLDNAVVRYSSYFASNSEWGKVKGIYYLAIGVALLISIANGLLLWFVSPWLASDIFSNNELEYLLRVMAFMVPLVAVFILHGQLLKGLKHIIFSQLVLVVGVPIFSILGLTYTEGRGGVSEMVVIYVVSSLIVVLISYIGLIVLCPMLRGVKPVFNSRVLFKSSVPLFYATVMGLIMDRSGTLFLGAMASPADVGLFEVANRTALLISFVLLAVNSVVAPEFSSLHSKGDIDGLSRILVNSSRFALLGAAPIFLVYVFFSEWVMTLFGDEFKSGAQLLIILAVGQLINTLSGSVGYLLMMTGKEHLWSKIVLLSVIINLVLMLILIPELGAMGAAISTAIALIVMNVVSIYVIWVELGILMNPFGMVRRY